MLALVCLTPWAYGAVHPGFEFLLQLGVGLMLLLWAVRMLLEGRLVWKKSPVALCLAGLFLLGAWQTVPLPRPLLASLSPSTARLYEQFLPGQRESLAPEASAPTPSPPPGSTLSLYPGATRQELARLLAVFLVFAAVYNNLSSPQVLGRLCAAALINGSLLALFALAQFFSSKPGTIYWTYPAAGHPFGPFINRNHFACYLNLCVGLGIGLLVSRGLGGFGRRREGELSSSDPSPSLLQVLHDPPSLWICAALALMVSSVAFSRSRGGVVALAGAAVVCAVLARLRMARSFRLGAGLLVAALAFALSAWFGLDLVKERLDTFWEGKALDNRLPLWQRSLPVAADFPLWGTGYGTYLYVEPMYRGELLPGEQHVQYEHTHNDYLEILLECGVPGLLLALLTIFLVYRLGARALARYRDGPAAGLTLGALFAFTTLVLHSGGEFGTHIPAITLLTTVVAAHLCALGRRDGAGEEYQLRLGGAAPLLGAATALSLALVLGAAAWKAHRIDRLQDAARKAGGDGEEQLCRRVTLLAAAARLGPDDARANYEFAQACARLAQRVEAGTHGPSPSKEEEPRERVVRAFVRARDACPLMIDAQLALATLAPRLARGDAQPRYLDRVKRLAGGRAECWFVCGRLELEDGREQDAWASWRRSLELADTYLAPIVQSALWRLSPAQLLEQVLPDKADVLLAAATLLYPEPDELKPRRPFLEKALRLLDTDPARLRPHDWHTRALIQRSLEQPDEAVRSYRELLKREPGRAEWRLELARYLFELRRLEEARRELVIVVSQQPRHGEARELLDRVTKELVEHRSDER